MSGYDGEGTGIGGTDDGRDVADSSIAGAGPNSALSLSEQYGEYGAGRQAAELASGMGIGREGGYSNLAGTAAQQGAFLAGGPTPAEQVAAGRPGVLETIGRGLLGLFGIASGTPQGVIGGALGLQSTARSSGLLAANPEPSDLGFAGNLGQRGAFSGSDAPSLFEGGDGPPDTGFTAGAPVLGFGGSVVNNAPQTTTTGSGVAPSLFPGLGAGYAPGGGLRYGAGFNVGAQPQQSAAPLLLLAAGASLFFMG